MTNALRQTPLHGSHVKAGARMVDFAGWHMPVQFSGITQEHKAVRERAGLFDVSHMGRFELGGSRAAYVVDILVTSSIEELPVGKGAYTVVCAADGGILDDLIVYRTGRSDLLIVCNANNRDKMSAHFENLCGRGCSFKERSDDTAMLALQGPLARNVLVEAGAGPELVDLGRFKLASGTVAGIEVRVARTGYTGEDGYELICSAPEAEQLWQSLLDAGKDSEILPVGLGARDTLRLEAGLRLYGNDMDETTTPYEAGLGWVVKTSGPDFVGRDALERKRREGVSRALVGFELTERGIARQGYRIYRGDRAVGTVTSGAPSPTLGKSIGMGYVRAGQNDDGTQLTIEIRGKRVPAVVVPLPFYKRSRKAAG